MDFVNTTPHKIVLCDASGTPVREYPPSKAHQLRMGSAPTEETAVALLSAAPPASFDFPVSSAPRWTDVEGEMPAAPILVSMPVGQFLAGRRHNVYGPDTGPEGVVRDDKGAIVGTKRLIKYSVGGD